LEFQTAPTPVTSHGQRRLVSEQLMVLWVQELPKE